MTYTVDWFRISEVFFLVPSVLSISTKDIYSQETAPQGTRVPPTQTFLGVHNIFLPHKRLLKREGKNVDQSQHTSDLGSSLWTLRNSVQDFRKDQEHLTFRTNCWINLHTFGPREIIHPLSPTFLSGAKLFFCHVQQLMYHTLYWACVLFGWSTLWLQQCWSFLR